ncbi:MAG: 30S ribosomal protein S19 [Nanoarchaeota archaeon]|nr:30S ribosomal protein S19 [Nanoarchaeota archaeon]MBU1135269.1 30S ribosomal protein S19 [Nanoarchaeota archaeon]MBU2519881.1 30S ribosomal protein S19 [Nanoarchaeota archaeon]
MAKFTMKGKELEEIEKMSLEEFRKLLPARRSRTLKRGFTPSQKKLLENIRANPKKFHKTHCRDLLVIPEMVGVRIGIHSGKEYVSIDIKPEMLGYKLGEFVPTRKIVKHSAPGFGATKSSKFVPLK